MKILLAILVFGSLSFAAATSEEFKSTLLKAEKGDASAQNKVGEMYHFGEGTPQDFAKAMTWYLKASDQGHPVAPNHIGRLYLNGEGVAKDEKEACQWYALSSERGDAAGKQNSQWCHDHKIGQ